MVALEQDHRRLNRSVEYRAAVDAELHDFHENSGFEDYFIIAGKLKRPDSGLSGKVWQTEAIKIIQGYVRLVVGRDLSLQFVQNITGRSKDSTVRYQVKVASVAESRELRSKFGHFFAGGEDKRPGKLLDEEVTIRNRVTQDTRVRIAILQVMAKRYRDSNKGAKANVITYEPRPALRITPPEGTSNGRTKTYHFVEAVRSFPTNFSAKDLDHILPKVSGRQFGSLKSVFICLSDDLRRPDRKSNDPGEVSTSGSGGSVRGKRGRSPGGHQDRPDKSSRH